MSSKKDKLLESAQKFIAKGQLDRAIKEYEQIAALDPNDIRHRQRLAELLVRVNRKDEAIGEYEAIGKYYSDNAYYLKAIAVYKQIQKLDPGNVKISLNLASLNEKQGLTGNALAEYGVVYSYYDKSGKQQEALSILESMIAIDPENLNTRLKFAETRFAAGSYEKAYEDFIHLVVVLKKRGDEGAYKQILDRIRHLFPAKKEGLALELLAAQLKSGETDTILPDLRELTARDQGNLAAWELLTNALDAAGETTELKGVLHKLVGLFPSELLHLERLIGLLLEADDAENAVRLLQDHHVAFLEQKAFVSLEGIYRKLLDKLPRDERIFRGLTDLYENNGDEKKLAEVREQLKLTDAGQGSEAYAEAPREPLVQQVAEEDDSSLSFMAVGTNPASIEEIQPEQQQVAPAVCSADEEATTVEFDLDLSDDEVPDVEGLQSEVPSEELGPVTEFSLPPIEEDTPSQDVLVDMDLELELSDSDFYEIPDVQLSSDHVPPDLGDDILSDLGDDILSDLGDDILSDLGDDILSEAPLWSESQGDSFEIDFNALSAADSGNDTRGGNASAIRKGEHLDDEDTETHYSLGIAFKEMGLYDDAIKEFQVAALDPSRMVDCLILQGTCCREKGDVERSVEILKKGLELRGLLSDQLSPIRYELAVAYEAAGQKEKALSMYGEIAAVDRAFRDTAEKIAALHGIECQENYELDLIELDGEVE